MQKLKALKSGGAAFFLLVPLSFFLLMYVLSVIGAIDSVSLTSPANASYSRGTNDTVAFNFSYSGDDTSANCTLFLNGTANATIEANASESATLYANETLSEGTYYWQVNCTNETESQVTNSQEWTLYMDYTPPDVVWISPDSNGTEAVNKTYIEWNISVTEDIGICLFEVNGTVTSNYTANFTENASESSYCYYNQTGIMENSTICAYGYASDAAGNMNVTLNYTCMNTDIQCNPSIANTSETTTLESCNISDQQLNWTWWVQWDQNQCGTFENITWYRNETLTCDYCQYNITNSSVTQEGNTTHTNHANISCNSSDILTLNWSWTQWSWWMQFDTNYSTCYAITNLPSDNFTNITWYGNTSWYNYTYESCDFCTPLLANTTPINHENISCNTSDILTLNWSWTQWDTNNCSEFTNLTWYNYSYETCDFCSYNVTNSTFSSYQNTSCSIYDNKTEWAWWVQYDSNASTCYGVTGIASDQWNNGDNNTWYSNTTWDCDYCQWNITNTTVSAPANTTCNVSDNLTEWSWWMQFDTNQSTCCAVTGNASDCFTNITWYSNTTQSCDYCSYNITNSSVMQQGNTTTLNYANISCNSSDIFTYGWNWTQWSWWMQFDSNYSTCYAVTNLPSDNFANITWYSNISWSNYTYETCDYCHYNITNSSVTQEGNTTHINHANISCNSSDTLTVNWSWTQWSWWMQFDTNYSTCYAITNLPSDSFTNITWYGNTSWYNYTYESCDFCTPYMINITWTYEGNTTPSNYGNVSCNSSDIFTYNWTWVEWNWTVEWDNMTCGEMPNTTYYDNITWYNHSYETCDFCTPSLANTTSTNHANISCNSSDTLTLNWSWTQWDTNNCSEFSNISWYNYTYESCDFCTPSLANTTWTYEGNTTPGNHANISCNSSDILTLNWSWTEWNWTVEWDTFVCNETSNYTHYYNITWYNYSYTSCDYCEPVLANDTWTYEGFLPPVNHANISCNSSDVLTYNWTNTFWNWTTLFDFNGCDGYQNNTIYYSNGTVYNYTYQACDFCVPSLANTTSTNHANISCNSSDTLTLNWSWTQWDTNNCSEFTNLTWYNYSYTACDFCTPSISNTTQAASQNTTCLSNNSLTNWTWWIQWDTNNCSEFANITWYQNNTLGCDYCTPYMVNTTWTDEGNITPFNYANVSCNTTDNFTYSWNWTQWSWTVEWDNQTCGEVGNTTHYSNTTWSNHSYESCNFCSFSPTNSSLASYQNTSCTSSNLTNWSYKIEYDANNLTCFALTGLSSDLWNGGANITHYDNHTISCDSTPPNIINATNSTIYPIMTYITWSLTESANASVLLGENSSALSVNASNASYATSWNLTVQYLAKNTTYYYNVTSCDAAGNCNTTGPGNFTTPDCNTIISCDSWSTCSSSSQSRTCTDANHCSYPWATTETQSCDDDDDDGGGNSHSSSGGVAPPANVSSRPQIVPGQGIVNNTKLEDAIEKVIENGNLSVVAKENLLRISASISSNMTAQRTMSYSGTRTKMQTKFRYSGRQVARNMMVYEKVPKTFASHVRDVIITCPGASVMVVEEDPAWLITYPVVEPGDELTITYDTAGIKPSSAANLTLTEIYAETLLDAAATGQEQNASNCTTGSKRCSGSNLEVCIPRGVGWTVLEACTYGCDADRLSCLQSPRPGSAATDETNQWSLIIVLEIVAIFTIAGLIMRRMRKGKKEKSKDEIPLPQEPKQKQPKAVPQKETRLHKTSEISADIRDGEPDVVMASVEIEKGKTTENAAKHKAPGSKIGIGRVISGLRRARTAVTGKELDESEKIAKAIESKVASGGKPKPEIAIATLGDMHRMAGKKGVNKKVPRSIEDADRKVGEMEALIEKVPQLKTTIEGLKKEISEHAKTVSQVKSIERSLKEEMAEIRDSISLIRDSVVKKSMESGVEGKEIEVIVEKAADNINSKVSDISLRMEKTFEDLKAKIDRTTQESRNALSEPLSSLKNDIDAIRSQLPNFIMKKDLAALGGGAESRRLESSHPEPQKAEPARAAPARVPDKKPAEKKSPQPVPPVAGAAESQKKSPQSGVRLSEISKIIGKQVTAVCTIKLFKSLDEPDMKIYWYKATDATGECIIASKEKIADGNASILATVKKTEGGTVYLEFIRNV